MDGIAKHLLNISGLKVFFLILNSFWSIFFHKIQKHESETKGRMGSKDLSSHRCLRHDSFDNCWLVPKYHFAQKTSFLPFCQSLLTIGQ